MMSPSWVHKIDYW